MREDQDPGRPRATIEDLQDRPIVEVPPTPASRRSAAPASGAAPSAARPARRRFGEGALIVCDNLVRIYKVADLEVVALQGLDLLVAESEMIAIVGASGSGKSTLLNILGGLDTPSAGRAVVAGHDLGRMGRRERTAYRRRVVGVIWQQTARNLLPYLSAIENVELPMVLDGKAARRQRATELLDLVSLGARAAHRPERLSGGEQQRVAVAVALANQPSVILADEPTGELDSQTSAEVFGLLRRVNQELGTTIVIVTHDPLVADQVQRTVAIRDGRTSSETVRRTEMTDDGHRIVAEEFAVLDRAGRLQLPKAHIESLHLADRVRLRLEEDHVGVWPDRHHTEGATPAAAARTLPTSAAPPGAGPAATPPSAGPAATPPGAGPAATPPGAGPAATAPGARPAPASAAAAPTAPRDDERRAPVAQPAPPEHPKAAPAGAPEPDPDARYRRPEGGDRR